MRAILIDPVNFTITEVQLPDDPEKLNDEIYRLLDCETFEVPLIRDNGDSLFIDEEGRLREDFTTRGFFALVDWPYEPYLCGKALLIGTNEEGESLDVESTVEEVIRTTGLGVVTGESLTIYPAEVAIAAKGVVEDIKANMSR